MIEKQKYEYYDMTQQEVADALGIERSYVGCIEQRAKAKIKIALEKRGFKLEDFIGGMA